MNYQTLSGRAPCEDLPCYIYAATSATLEMQVERKDEMMKSNEGVLETKLHPKAAKESVRKKKKRHGCKNK